MKPSPKLIAACALFAASAGLARGQIVINEVWENPPNGGDQTYEYIEIYGPPDYDLTGYAVVLVKGAPEVDEAFSLDGFRTDANGFFVIHNSTASGSSGVNQWGGMLVNPNFNPIMIASRTNRPFLNGVPFRVAHIPSTDTVGKLENDGSSTYLLVRRRPMHALEASGDSVYAATYAWRKDVNPDADLNSRLDFGDETGGARPMQPVQIVDEVAWSNTGQREYNIPGRGLMSAKISETPGFNPDAVARVRYLGHNPLAGWTIDDLEAVRTTVGDECWIYGEVQNVTPGTANYGLFKHFYENNRTERTFGAPTDPDGNLYSYLEGRQPPIYAPFFELTDSFDPVNGTQLFEPYDITGARMSPGTFNDAPAGSVLHGTAIAQQFRFVRGDFNFDGAVDCDDRALIALAAAESWTLDDTQDQLRPGPGGTEVPYAAFARQVQDFNGTLAMIRMSLTDGSTGEWTSGQVLDTDPVSPTFGKIIAWGGAVTAADLAAFDAEFPELAGAACNPCPADWNGDEAVTSADISAFLAAWLASLQNQTLEADFSRDGAVNSSDISAFLTAWLAAVLGEC